MSLYTSLHSFAISILFFTVLNPCLSSCVNPHHRKTQNSGTGIVSGGHSPASGSIPPVQSGTPPDQNSSTSNNYTGQFWAGADIDTLLRAEALPGRTYYDFDGKTVKDPIQTLGDSDINTFRVEGGRTMCTGPKPFVNTSDPLGDEINFKLDFGCLTTKVEIAKRAKAAGMTRMVFTVNQGRDIPQEMANYTYSQMIENIQQETKRQLQPFLTAGILPDVILLENEGSDGFLMNDPISNHARGHVDPKVSLEVVNKERCGLVPTGNINSYPQYAGYLKAEIVACNEIIKAAGFSLDTVRYGLHSHQQYVQFKESLVHGPNRLSQKNLTKVDKSPCDNENPIPSDLLNMDVAGMLTIAGFSAYPNPATPTDVDSDTSILATLDELTKTLTEIQDYSKEFGVFASGPFKGQSKLQSLGVEFATAFPSTQIKQQQRATQMMWDRVKTFSNCLGMMWYEPWYGNAHFEGGKATLCHIVNQKLGTNIMGMAPTDTMKTWGAGAVSPWKNASTTA